MIRLVLISVAILFALPASAQVNVRLDIERERYLLYEPMIVTVEIGNYSASPLQLTDQESTPWLRFEITRSNGERIGVVGPGFLAGTFTLEPGQGKAKTADLVAYYQIREPGKYRIRAMVKVNSLGGSFASREQVVEVVGGRQLTAKTAGFKDESGKDCLRNYSVMEVRLGTQVWLYARVEDQQGENIYGVVPLGEWVTFSAPTVDTDKQGNLHVLHQAQPRHFRYSVISPRATAVKRESFSNYNTLPELKRTEDGQLKVVGGESMNRQAPPRKTP